MKIAVVDILGECEDVYNAGFSCIPFSLRTVGNEVHKLVYNEPIPDDINEYDLVIISLNDIDICKQWIEKITDPFLVIFPDGISNRFEELDFIPRLEYIKALNKADLILCSSRHMEQYLRMIVKDPTKPRFIGFPINVNGMLRYIQTHDVYPVDENLIYLGYIRYRPDRNVFLAMSILKKLGLKGLAVHFGGDTEKIYQDILDELGLDNITLVPPVTPHESLEYVGRCSASFNLSSSFTIGRMAAESAVFNRLSVGTANFYQEEFFPYNTILDPNDLSYIECSLTSPYSVKSESLLYYIYTHWGKRFNELVETIKDQRSNVERQIIIQDDVSDSASKIINIVKSLYKFRGAIDFGCGIGTWLNVARNYCDGVFGIDINCNPINVRLGSDEYMVSDLSWPIDSRANADLAISIETAEHLPAERVKHYMENIVKARPKVIIFSAAIVGQGGYGHINEQPQSFWANQFRKYGYYPCDMRKEFSKLGVRDLYRRNCIVYISGSVKENFAPFVVEKVKDE